MPAMTAMPWESDFLGALELGEALPASALDLLGQSPERASLLRWLEHAEHDLRIALQLPVLWRSADTVGGIGMLALTGIHRLEHGLRITAASIHIDLAGGAAAVCGHLGNRWLDSGGFVHEQALSTAMIASFAYEDEFATLLVRDEISRISPVGAPIGCVERLKRYRDQQQRRCPIVDELRLRSFRRWATYLGALIRRIADEHRQAFANSQRHVLSGGGVVAELLDTWRRPVPTKPPSCARPDAYAGLVSWSLKAGSRRAEQCRFTEDQWADFTLLDQLLSERFPEWTRLWIIQALGNSAVQLGWDRALHQLMEALSFFDRETLLGYQLLALKVIRHCRGRPHATDVPDRNIAVAWLGAATLDELKDALKLLQFGELGKRLPSALLPPPCLLPDGLRLSGVHILHVTEMREASGLQNQSDEHVAQMRPVLGSMQLAAFTIRHEGTDGTAWVQLAQASGAGWTMDLVRPAEPVNAESLARMEMASQFLLSLLNGGSPIIDEQALRAYRSARMWKGRVPRHMSDLLAAADILLPGEGGVSDRFWAALERARHDWSSE